MSRGASLEGVDEASSMSSASGSLDGVIELESEGASTPVRKAVGGLFGKEGLGEVEQPQGAVDEAERREAAKED